MTTPSTDTHHSMDACPPLEDIAAFLDDMLSPEERERMTAHLARCESCYEIFLGAAEFREEESSAEDTGEVVHPFPLTTRQDRAPRRTYRLLLPLAASIVLTAGVGFFAWQALRPPEVTLAGVASALQDRPGVGQHLYEGDNPRGLEEPGSMFDRPEFMVGVHLLDLQFSETSVATEGVTTEGLLQDLGNELKASYSTEDLGERYLKEYGNFRGLDDRQQEARLRELEAEVQERLEESSSFAFGLWTEGGRLSAATKSPEFFEDRNNRRFLSLLREDPPVPDDLREQVLGELQAIESLWGKDFSALQTHFENIINAVDRYEDELLEESPL